MVLMRQTRIVRTHHTAVLAVSLLAVLSMFVLLLFTHRMIVQTRGELMGELDRRLMLAAGRTDDLVNLVRSQYPAIPPFPPDAFRMVIYSLGLILQTAQLDNIYIMSPDQRVLADPRYPSNPSNWTPAFALSAEQSERVLSGQAVLLESVRSGSLSYRAIAYPLMLDGKVKGLICGQASMDFDPRFQQLSRRWRQAGFFAAGMGFVLLGGGVWVFLRLLRLHRLVDRQARTDLIQMLAAGALHEIRNPLSTILVSSELLKKRLPRRPEYDELIDYIAGEARAIEATADELLGRAGVRDCRDVALGHLAEELVRRLHPRIQRVHAVVHVAIPESCVVYTHVLLLKLVLTNLLVNALEAVPADGGRIEIASHEAPGWIGISVADNGSGIPWVRKRRLFDSFRSGKPDGRGFGLAVSRMAVDELRGRLEATPNRPRGTVFTVWLPRCTRSDQDSLRTLQRETETGHG